MQRSTPVHAASLGDSLKARHLTVHGSRFTLHLLVLAFVLASGCTRNEAATAPAVAPQVAVATVLERAVSDFDEYSGRIEPVERVEIRPRVSGYVSSVEFVEGSEVQAGDVLFVIDPRPYEADLKRARAERARAITALALANSERERATRLLSLRAVSQEEFDARVAGHEQAIANVEATEAAVDTAELNLTFTRVRAPIAGLVGVAEITAGNLVTSGQTLLTTLVSIDPVYVEFEGDERLYLRYVGLPGRAYPPKGQTDPRAAGAPIWVGVADEQGHPHEGNVVFLDNELDRGTGTIRVRGHLRNTDRRFTPGMFARVKLTTGDSYGAVLVRDSAIGTDQNLRYVLVLDAANTVQYRAVKLGPLVDGLRVVREGLTGGDTIVVNGLQRVRPGTSVSPERVAMDVRADGTTLTAHNRVETRVDEAVLP